MAVSEERKREYTKRLMLSKMRVLMNHGFFGLLLSHMHFSLDEKVETACTDGQSIIFGTGFLDELSDSEVDFILMHEIMHVVLQHCFRDGKRNRYVFNVACDIVVNSLIMQECGDDPGAITLRKYGESMHVAPDGKEGREYTAEQVYEMLEKKYKLNRPEDKNDPGNGFDSDGEDNGTDNPTGDEDVFTWDDHTKWDGDGDDEARKALKEEWDSHIRAAMESLEIRESSTGMGGAPLFAKRMLKAMDEEGQTDWRTILNEFIQEELCDYSFSPPDRRFSDSPFFLPDFNEKDEKVQNIWFLVDTSGSIGDKAMTAAYNEIKSAIEQFGGALEGYLSFTEATVTDPIPFTSVEELLAIKPRGGGGNDFSAIFRYMKKNMMDDPPSYIIIITDGYDRFPKESDAMGIPVLWIINNQKVTPPWGKVARITVT